MSKQLSSSSSNSTKQDTEHQDTNNSTSLLSVSKDQEHDKVVEVDNCQDRSSSKESLEFLLVLLLQSTESNTTSDSGGNHHDNTDDSNANIMSFLEEKAASEDTKNAEEKHEFQGSTIFLSLVHISKLASELFNQARMMVLRLWGELLHGEALLGMELVRWHHMRELLLLVLGMRGQRGVLLASLDWDVGNAVGCLDWHEVHGLPLAGLVVLLFSYWIPWGC